MLPNALRFNEIQSVLVNDLFRFGPELILCLAIVVMLFAKLFKFFSKVHFGMFSVCAVFAAALWLCLFQLNPNVGNGANSSNTPKAAFEGMLALDQYSFYFRLLVLIGSFITLSITQASQLYDADDSADFGTLLLGATVGMMTMVSANHLLILFLTFEMASLPSYVLVGFIKGRAKSSEAALKYVIFGAASSGIMLFGISLLMGQFGTGLLPEIVSKIVVDLKQYRFTIPLLTSLIFLGVGLAYKLSAVPFHFWLPDAFEGAAAEVAGFVSVVSKTAAVGLAGRLILQFISSAETESLSIAYLQKTIGMPLLAIAILTTTIGNILALTQTNLKRLFAYSTIAHAGFLIMGLCTITKAGIQAVSIYMFVYTLMNLVVFGSIAAIRNVTGSEELTSAQGFVSRYPAIGIPMIIAVVGLLGLPPIAGFAGKFMIFQEVFQAGKSLNAVNNPFGKYYYILLAVGLINTAISAGYYLKVLKVVGLDSAEGVTYQPLSKCSLFKFVIFSLGLILIILGLYWTPLSQFSAYAISR